MHTVDVDTQSDLGIHYPRCVVTVKHTMLEMSLRSSLMVADRDYRDMDSGLSSYLPDMS